MKLLRKDLQDELSSCAQPGPSNNQTGYSSENIPKDHPLALSNMIGSVGHNTMGFKDDCSCPMKYFCLVIIIVKYFMYYRFYCI